MISEMARMLHDPRCDEDTYLEVIHEYGLPEGSEEYRQLQGSEVISHNRGEFLTEFPGGDPSLPICLWIFSPK
jgi:hypothetical protein